jgi:hypothetical protein
MTGAPELDAERGRLLIGEPTLRVLVAHAADPVDVALQGEEAVRELAALQAAGVIAGGRAHPSVAGALAAMVRPELCTLELSYSGKAMQGWLTYDAAALLLPERDGGEGRRTLLALHPTVVPGALAALVDLGPRPAAGARGPRVYTPEPRVSTPGAPEPRVSTPDSFPQVRRRWRLEATWRLPDGVTGGDGLEVLDSADGLWMLTTGDERGQPIAWPVTPTLVWRQIVRVVMRRAADAAQ